MNQARFIIHIIIKQPLGKFYPIPEPPPAPPPRALPACRCPRSPLATPDGDALDALGGVAAGPPHEPIAIRLIRDIRPRCALAAAAHVAMIDDVVVDVRGPELSDVPCRRKRHA